MECRLAASRDKQLRADEKLRLYEAVDDWMKSPVDDAGQYRADGVQMFACGKCRVPICCLAHNEKLSFVNGCFSVFAFCVNPYCYNAQTGKC